MRWIDLYYYKGDTLIPNKKRIESGSPLVLSPGEQILVPRYTKQLGGTSGQAANVYVQAPAAGQSRTQATLMVQGTEERNGTPVEGARVHVRPSAPSAHAKCLPVQSGHTDAEGEVVFERLPPGTYEVQACRDGFQAVDPPPVRTLTVQPDAVNEMAIELRSEASIKVVRALLNQDERGETLAPAQFVRIGLWDRAYEEDSEGRRYVRDEEGEDEHFVGADTRRFYVVVYDPSVPRTKRYIHIDWKTLKNDGSDDHAPPSQRLTLERTGPRSRHFVSRAVMLTSDDVDQNHPTHSGHSHSAADPGPKSAGQSNHRMRKVTELGGFVKGTYVPACGGTTLSVQVPTFNPDELRRLPLHIVNYQNRVGWHAGRPCVTQAYITKELERANDRWRQTGLKIEQAHYEERTIPLGGVDERDGRFPYDSRTVAGRYDFLDALESLMGHLIPITDENTVTVAFIPMKGARGLAFGPCLPALRCRTAFRRRWAIETSY